MNGAFALENRPNDWDRLHHSSYRLWTSRCLWYYHWSNHFVNRSPYSVRVWKSWLRNSYDDVYLILFAAMYVGDDYALCRWAYHMDCWWCQYPWQLCEHWCHHQNMLPCRVHLATRHECSLPSCKQCQVIWVCLSHHFFHVLRPIHRNLWMNAKN